MIVVYDSNTGIGKRFAESLGYPTQSIKEKLEEPCILITRNAGAGKIPWSTTMVTLLNTAGPSAERLP